MQRIITTSPEVLGYALRDVINTYTREIIIARKLIGESQLELLDSEEVQKEINTIIVYFIEKWSSCIIDDEVN